MLKRPPVMKPSRLPGVITGQIIPVHRPVYGAATIAVAVSSCLLFFGGLALIGPGLGQGIVLVAGLGTVMILAAGALLGVSRYLRTHAPHLIIGGDRVQFWQGKGQPVEVFYDAIARIEVVPCRGPLLLPGRGIGIELSDPHGFDDEWPALRAVRARNRRRRGVDVIIPTQLLAESAERCYDTLLTAYHRYRREVEGEVGRSLPS
jgi:hypothetical protein